MSRSQMIDARGQQPRGLQNEIIGTVAAIQRAWPGCREGECVADIECQRIGTIGEGYDAFEVVITVYPSSHHTQGQIDLRARLFN